MMGQARPGAPGASSGAGRLAGGRVVVTGASGGIGRAVALACAAEGADLALTYRSSAADAEAVAAEIRATETDTTGTNALLVALCQELGIRYVLTTEASPWARGAAREVDIARRLMYHAVTHRTLPRHVDSRLVTVKDPAMVAYTEAELRALQAQITDPNYRIFTDGERIHVFNGERFVSGTEPSEIFPQLDVEEASHAFYLSKELTKAKLAIDLGKTYRQEGELSWGYLAVPERAEGERVRPAQRESRLPVAREQADRRRAAERRRDGG